MSDHSQLKALALACSQEPWAYEPHGDTDTYGVGVMWDRNDQPVTGYQECGETLVVKSIAPEVNGSNYAAFIAAASPVVVLELLTALEKLQRANAAQADHINQQQDRIDTLEGRNGEIGKHVGQLELRNKELTESTLVPGVMHCAKCQFQLTKTNLYMKSGTTGPGDSKSEPCPNGCGPLWPVTWKQYATEAYVLVDRYYNECEVLKQRLQQPVKLPDKGFITFAGERHYTYDADQVIAVLKEQGFKVEGE